MPTDKESFLKGIRTYCERNNVSQYDAVLCEKSAEYGWLYALDPEAFERGVRKVEARYAVKSAQTMQANDGDEIVIKRKKKKPANVANSGGFFNDWKPWVLGGATLLGGIGLGTMYGRHAQRTGNPYGFWRGGAIDIGEFLTGRDLRYHPEKAFATSRPPQPYY